MLIPVALVASSCAHGGYEELISEMEGYQPPALVRAASAPPTGATSEPDDFKRQVALLAETKARWEESLSGPGDEPVFLAPAPALLARLEPAAADAGVAAGALGDGFTMETLELLALLRSPAVASAGRSFRAALEGYDQVSNLDEILRQYSAFTGSLMADVGPMAGDASPAKLFPFPGVLALKGRIVTREVLMAREKLEEARKEAVTEARKSYWELLYNLKAREIVAGTLVQLGQLENSARSRYEVGKGTLQDVVRWQTEAERMREEFRTLAAEWDNLAQAVRRLVDLPSPVPVGHPASREPDRVLPAVDRLGALARERRQDLRTMRHEIARMELMIEMAETEIYPPFTQGLSVYENRPALQAGTMRMEEPFVSVTAASTGAGLPRNAWYGMGDAYLRETREVLASMRARLTDLERGAELLVREGWFALDRALREEALHAGRLEELYGLAADSAARSYETGMTPLREAIEFTLGRLGAAISAERRKADAGVARAELERTVGTTLSTAGQP